MFNEDMLEDIAGLTYSRRRVARSLLVRCRGSIQAPQIDQVRRYRCRTDDNADQRRDHVTCQETCTSFTST